MGDYCFNELNSNYMRNKIKNTKFAFSMAVTFVLGLIVGIISIISTSVNIWSKYTFISAIFSIICILVVVFFIGIQIKEDKEFRKEQKKEGLLVPETKFTLKLDNFGHLALFLAFLIFIFSLFRVVLVNLGLDSSFMGTVFIGSAVLLFFLFSGYIFRSTSVDFLDRHGLYLD